MKINKKAQSIINRISKVMELQPEFDLAKVEQALKRHYELLNIPMPKIEVANDMVVGYEIARDAAWGAARGAARGAAWGAAWDAARDAARDAAWDAAWGAARGAAWGAAWDAARGAAWDAARDAARDAAWDAAWGAAATNTALKDERVIRYIEIELEMLKALEAGLGFYFPMRDKLILVPFPAMKVDERKRLHNLGGPAVEWKGGAKFYFINGVRFEEKIYQKLVNKKIGAKEILKLGNMEQRMIGLKIHGAENLLTELKAELLDKSTKGNELYSLKGIFSQDAFFLKYSDPSTGRVYVSGIDPAVGVLGDADKCMGWKFGLSKKEYLGIIAEA